MIIIEQPYASELLIDTIVQNDFKILDNDVIRSVEIEDGALSIISQDDAKKYYMTQEYPLIYSNSENSISWVLENLPESNLSKYIKLFKDKLAFRDMLKEFYPDFYYQAVDFTDLKKIKLDDIKFPVVIKPTVGFLSIGVHTVQDRKEWKEVIDKLDKEMSNAKKLYPEHVVSSTKFLIEELIKGQEFAIDAYYDRDGEPVFLNIFQHPFLNSQDVKDRIYITSVGIMIRYMAPFGQLLRKIGKLNNIRNFPMHFELRVTPSGDIIPLEVNPMRFAGWCTTDLANYAWGINVYEYFHNQIKPDWNDILNKSSSRVYYFSMAEVPSNFDRKNYKGFDYDKFLSNFSNVLEVRKINPIENPLFAILFGSTASEKEILKILSIKTQEYLL